MLPAQLVELSQNAGLRGDVVTNPPRDSSWAQRVLVVCRPGWWRLARSRLCLAELSGALGDLGTFLPLTVNLAARPACGIDFGAALLMAGVCNLGTALWFDIPIAVQPMHTICSVAVANGLGPGEILGAGLFVGASTLVLGGTGLLERARRAIPLAVVRGIQLGIGLGLVRKGVADRAYGAYVRRGHAHEVVWVGWDSVLVSVAIFALLLATARRPRFPGALLVFAWGCCVALATSAPARAALELGVTVRARAPTAAELGRGAFQAGLPQLPLTLLNSVVALSLLAKDLFPGRDASTARVALSVGGLNLALLWFGGLPSCHGAGGLAAQHRFGARSNVSMLWLGGLKVALALLFGRSLMALCQALPASVLGTMLAFSGLELAMCAAGEGTELPQQRLVMLITAGTELALKSGVAFVVGMAAAAVLRAAAWSDDGDRKQRGGGGGGGCAGHGI